MKDAIQSVIDVECFACKALPGAGCTRKATLWERFRARLRNIRIVRVPCSMHSMRCLHFRYVVEIKSRTKVEA
jgi:hypothetical protein